MRATLIAYGLWLVFIASWYAAMLWTARAVSRGGWRATIGWVLGFAVGFWLLFGGVAGALHPSARYPWPLRPLWHAPLPVAGLLVALEVGSFAFAWWARIHLGRLWSGMMTLREGHRVVDTGPYRVVRHPIYTGFIGAAWCFATILAEPAALLGASVLTLTMSLKARAEEALLRRELGASAYDAYAARTARLIPWGPR